MDGDAVADQCLRQHNVINVVVAGKQPALQYLPMEEAVKHVDTGIGIWEWASNDRDGEPDAVMACCGDIPTLETLAAVDLLRGYFPNIKLRVVNVVDLMRLQPEKEHPHGLPDDDFDMIFTTDKPIVFAFHGYPWLVHRLTYRRRNHRNLHVRGYKEEGTTTTPFARIKRANKELLAAYVKQELRNKLIEHNEYICKYGDDIPEVRDWKWPR